MASSPSLRRLLTKTQTLLSDSYSLTSALLTAQPTSVASARSVLLTQAKTGGNTVAASVLLLDREVGLVKYHGLAEYVREKGPWESASGEHLLGLNRFLFGPPSHGGGNRSGSADGRPHIADANADADATGQCSGPTRKARVAFMITAAQRQELTTTLGYTQADIRRLRPLEALLILEHGVKPGNDEIVQRLVEENEDMERRETEWARRVEEDKPEAEEEEDRLRMTAAEDDEAGKNLAEKAGENNAEATVASSASASPAHLSLEVAEPASPTTRESALGRTSSAIEMDASIVSMSSSAQSPSDPPSHHPQASTSQLDISPGFLTGESAEQEEWYEVVETECSTGKSTVVALYKTINEAEDCLGWKEGRGSANSYKIRRR